MTKNTKEQEIKLTAIFASGAGSNAQKIIDHLLEKEHIGKIALIVCNKASAGVMNIAKNHGIETILLDKELFFNTDTYLNQLKERNIDFIVLAGFLWKVPLNLIQAYPNKIVNIHPALLPKYGGKGMYGRFVHEEVIKNEEAESGITIHYVDEIYDHGNIIFQATCKIDDNETPDSLAHKIHLLEHKHYPVIIENILLNQNLSRDNI